MKTERRKTGPKPNIEQYKRVLKLRNSGDTFVVIGKKMGLSKSRAHQIVERAIALKLHQQHVV